MRHKPGRWPQPRFFRMAGERDDMSSPLGKIDKPEADQYQEGRKIFLVPLFLSPPDGPDDLKALLEEYWEGAGEHVARLEASLGPVSHIFP